MMLLSGGKLKRFPLAFSKLPFVFLHYNQMNNNCEQGGATVRNRLNLCLWSSPNFTTLNADEWKCFREHPFLLLSWFCTQCAAVAMTSTVFLRWVIFAVCNRRVSLCQSPPRQSISLLWQTRHIPRTPGRFLASFCGRNCFSRCISFPLSQQTERLNRLHLLFKTFMHFYWERNTHNLERSQQRDLFNRVEKSLLIRKRGWK